MPTKQDYVEAVQNGNETSDQVAEAVGVSREYTCRVLKDLTEDGKLARERTQNGFEYRLPTKKEAHQTPAAKEAQSRTYGTSEDDDGLMPVNRNYDWDSPDFKANPAEYFATDGELERSLAQINSLDVTGTPFRSLIDGPTGCGKTTFAETIAAANDAVYVEIQMSQGMTDADLLGSPSFAGGETVWVDGPITKAMLASRDRMVVLLIDEVNRAPAYVKNALFSALDHRGAVRLDGPRGGEVIQGNPQNILVVATMNQGDPYHGTERMDLAEQTRYTSRFSVDYLASEQGDTEGIEKEAELLVRRTPVHADLARDMVETAAMIRSAAKDSTNTTVKFGIPTRSMISWASRSYDYNEAGIDKPIIQAAEDTVAKVIYGDNGSENAYDEVLGIIEDNLGNVPFDESEFQYANADEYVACGNCEYMEPKEVAKENGVLAKAMCPECGSDDIKVVEN